MTCGFEEIADRLPARIGRLSARVADRQYETADRFGRARFVFLLAHVRIISMPHGRAIRSAALPDRTAGRDFHFQLRESIMSMATVADPTALARQSRRGTIVLLAI